MLKHTLFLSAWDVLYLFHKMPVFLDKYLLMLYKLKYAAAVEVCYCILQPYMH